MFQMRIGIICVILSWMFFSVFSLAGEEFRIAVAGDSQEKTGQISKVAARADYFLIFDRDGNLLETVANPHAGTARGAGPKAAKFLAEKRINLVIAGKIGAKMAKALKGDNINYIEKQGIVINEVKGVEHAE